MSTLLNKYQHFFFVGIAGTGMSAIAQYLAGTGKKVSGSDRIFGEKKKYPIQDQLENQNINCYYQDGSGITKDVDVVIVSTAIEKSNVEYAKAEKTGIPIMKRSELLAAISTSKRTIAIGGTSGKSTTAAMVFHILEETGLSPSLMTGAGLVSLQQQGLIGNAWVGKSDWLVIEADESDGSIVNYHPEISVILNIDRDHKELDELIGLFKVFQDHTSSKCIVNHDSPISKKLSKDSSNDFGTSPGVGYTGEEFEQKGFQILFKVNGISFKVPVIGKHNMENALAAVAVSAAAGIRIEDASKALESYTGIYRRTQLVTNQDGILVIDDFAHNPAEIAAAIRSCQSLGSRVYAWFQPHGYEPLRFIQDDLVKEVSSVLRDNDLFIMSDVYYAGGTVTKDISSSMVIDKLKEKIPNVKLINNRVDLKTFLAGKLRKGDVVLLMGARDPSLAEFASTFRN